MHFLIFADCLQVIRYPSSQTTFAFEHKRRKSIISQQRAIEQRAIKERQSVCKHWFPRAIEEHQSTKSIVSART